jgi:hypothetical protein
MDLQKRTLNMAINRVAIVEPDSTGDKRYRERLEDLRFVLHPHQIGRYKTWRRGGQLDKEQSDRLNLPACRALGIRFEMPQSW